MYKYIIGALTFIVVVLFVGCWLNQEVPDTAAAAEDYDVESDPIMQEYITLEMLRLELDGEEPIGNNR